MINVDGSFVETTGDGSTGAVIRDASGGFIAASYSYIFHVLDATMAEASALRDGLLLAQQIGSLIGTTYWFSYWHNILVPIMCKSKRTVWMWLIQCLMEVSQLRPRQLFMRNAINYGRILLQFRLLIVTGRVIQWFMS